MFVRYDVCRFSDFVARVITRVYGGVEAKGGVFGEYLPRISIRATLALTQLNMGW